MPKDILDIKEADIGPGEKSFPKIPEKLQNNKLSTI